MTDLRQALHDAIGQDEWVGIHAIIDSVLDAWQPPTFHIERTLAPEQVEAIRAALDAAPPGRPMVLASPVSTDEAISAVKAAAGPGAILMLRERDPGHWEASVQDATSRRSVGFGYGATPHEALMAVWQLLRTRQEGQDDESGRDD